MTGAGFALVLPFSFLRRLIKNRKSHCYDDCWVSFQSSGRGETRHNLGFTIWRCRERSPNSCFACYYSERFQPLCRSPSCQAGGPWQVLSSSPPAPLQNECSPSVGLQQPSRALDERSHSSTKDHHPPVPLQNTRWLCPGGHWFLQKTSAELCRLQVSSCLSYKHLGVGTVLCSDACKSPLWVGCSVSSNSSWLTLRSLCSTRSCRKISPLLSAGEGSGRGSWLSRQSSEGLRDCSACGTYEGPSWIQAAISGGLPQALDHRSLFYYCA